MWIFLTFHLELWLDNINFQMYIDEVDMDVIERHQILQAALIYESSHSHDIKALILHLEFKGIPCF